MQSIALPRRNAGFTLVELMLVVLILAILAGILLPILEDTQEQTADARRASDLHSMQSALESYYRVNGAYPDTGGAWQGDAPNFGGFGYGPAGYVPGLVPDVMQALPTDPSAEFPDAGDGGYMYRSDGSDYKFVINLSPDSFPQGNPFYDPVRPDTAWQVSSPGGYNW